MSKCEICGKEGFHKMSCPTQKVMVFLSDVKVEGVTAESEGASGKHEGATKSGMSEIPTNQSDRKIGNTDFVICNRVNRTDNNRCINCGAKSGHPCQMKPNESNYC